MRFLRLVAATAVVAGTLAAAALIWVALGLRQPADRAGSERMFVIAPGEPLAKVVRRLDKEGLLPKRAGFGPRVVVAYARLQGLDRKVKTGEYALSPAQSPLEILQKLASGEVETHALTLPEGLNVWEIAKRIEESGVAPANAVLELAFSPKFAKDLGVEGDSLEGYLYPETYRFARGTDPATTLRTMVQQFKSQWTDSDRAQLARSGRTMRDVVTLASIVGKESGGSSESDKVAAVFLNRLQRGMRLQSDPTVIYGILLRTGSFDGNLRRVDLENDSPYNTYRRGGIPPGPIASVSIRSIRAVLAPAKVKYLYFVSRNNGTHQFSNTLVEHNLAVRRFQLGDTTAAAAPEGDAGDESAYSAEAKRPPQRSSRR